MNNVSLEFQSLKRLPGREFRSKLLARNSRLYAILHRVKANILARRFKLASDRMDLHIQLVHDGRDSHTLETRTAALHGHALDLLDIERWTFLRRSFVLYTPPVPGYGATHITIAYFSPGEPLPNTAKMRQIVLQTLKEILADSDGRQKGRWAPVKTQNRS